MGWPLGDAIGGITFLVVVWALYASLRAASETSRSNILAHVPVLTLKYDVRRDEAKLVNVGHGSAVNVRVDNFYQWWADDSFNLYGLTKTVFERVGLLKQDEEVALKNRSIGTADPFGLATFTMFSAREKSLIFAIRFSDLSGVRFITKVKLHNNEVEVILFPRRLNFLMLLELCRMRVVEAAVYCYYGARVIKKRHDTKKRKSQRSGK